MSLSKFGLPALSFEILAWGQLALSGSSDQKLILYLGLHAIASFFFALLAFQLLPYRYKTPRRPVVCLLFAPIYFLPILGFVGILIAVFVPALLPKFIAQQNFRLLQLPEPDPHERTQQAPFGRTGARSFLSNTKAPMDLRLRALVGLQNIPSRVSSPLLRDLLADPAEDIRLLAYGMLDNLEKRLNSKIHKTLQDYHDAQDNDEKILAARKLSQLFWELLYQGLVQGDLAKHAAEQALNFTQIALEADDADPGLYLARGRLLQQAGFIEKAQEDYNKALSLGLPNPRVIPYLAEIAYDQRNYREVKQLLASMHNWQSLPKLQPIIKFWSSR